MKDLDTLEQMAVERVSAVLDKEVRYGTVRGLLSQVLSEWRKLPINEHLSAGNKVVLRGKVLYLLDNPLFSFYSRFLVVHWRRNGLFSYYDVSFS